MILSKPQSAPINKQDLEAVKPIKKVKQVELPKPQLVKVAKKTAKPKAKPVVKRQERPKPKPVAKVKALPTSKTELMKLAGIPEKDFSHVNYIVHKESSWNYRAVNRSSGATGLCQALPASKMASVGRDYRTNPVTQLKWCHQYAKSRYGSWYSAFAFWQAKNWW